MEVINIPAIRARMLISSVRFLIAAMPLKAIGKMPTATAPIANHWNGWYKYLNSDTNNRNPQIIVYGLGHFFL